MEATEVVALDTEMVRVGPNADKNALGKICVVRYKVCNSLGHKPT
jgi:hypothetical protein